MTEDQRALYKRAGYSHYVCYLVWKPFYKNYVQIKFPTTKNMVDFYSDRIKKTVGAKDLTIVEI